MGDGTIGYDALALSILDGAARPAAERGGRAPSPVEPDGVARYGEPFPLYDLADVAAAIGERGGAEHDGYEGDPEEIEAYDDRHDTEHLCRLRAILRRGEAGRWRTLLGPRPDAVAALDDLASKAPHMAELSTLVRDHLQAALTIGMPCVLPSLLIEGEPGVGKTWFMSRLGEVLAVPRRSIALSSSSLGDTVVGSNPTWRNARGGMTSRLLLMERVANGFFAVDEFDKAGSNAYNPDPYRAYYAVLDPSNSREFVDEFYGFKIDASKISWAMLVNDASLLPAPIADRLVHIRVPELTQAHRAAVAASIYELANAARRDFFEPMTDALLDRLLDLSPRAVRIALDAAMVRAAAQGRRRLAPDDVRMRRPERPSFGFRLGGQALDRGS